MKILIDARLYGLENAGLGRYSINLVRELSRLDGKNEYGILLRRKYYRELNLPKNWTKILADVRHYSLKEQVVVLGLIYNFSPDLVHFLHFNVPYFYKGDYVVTIHDMLMHKRRGRDSTTLPSYFHFVKKLGYIQIFGRAVRRAKNIIVPSKYVAREVSGYYNIKKDKIDVVYEGVDGEIKGGGERGIRKYGVRGKYFLYVGNLYPHKNVLRAIEACVELNNKLSEKVMFVVVTSRGAFLEKLKREASSFGGKPCLKVLQNVSDKELSSLYSNSLGFVYPTFSEGFGLPGLEAMACGTLVLASEIEVFKEIYGDNAVYFNPYSFTSIERAMADVVAMDSKKRAAKIKKGRLFVKRYSWEENARATLEVYNEALK